MRCLALLTVLLSASALAQSADYFPLDLEDVWVFGYVNERVSPPDTTRLEPRRIRGSAPIRDTAYVLITLPGIASDTLRKDAQGRIWSRINGGDHLLLDVTLQNGETYEFPLLDLITPGYTYTVTVHRPATIEVPAGRFENVIIFYFHVAGITDSDRWVYLAPGVGIIKGGYGFGGPELIEATVGGAIFQDTEESPESTRFSAFPNPFVRSLTVELPRGDWQTVELVDALGRRVATLPNGPCASSSCRLTWDATDAAPGVYTVWATGPSGTARQHVVRAR